jgi:hypothetical protein
MSASPSKLIGLRMAAALCAAGIGLVSLPRAASAQGFANFQGAPTGPVVGSAEDNKNTQKQAAPPALPGARVNKSEAAPAEPGAADLPPTEALFDAINRGDMLSARDAVNRGADLNGHNVLGLTPLDLSVDLGRNDITFLLLSLRPANPTASATGQGGPAKAGGATAAATRGNGRRGSRVAAAPPTDAGAAAPTAGSVGAPPLSRAELRRQERLARIADEKARKQAAAGGAAPAASPSAGSQQPRQYAGDKGPAGTPVPQMGFVGFGSVTR